MFRFDLSAARSSRRRAACSLASGSGLMHQSRGYVAVKLLDHHLSVNHSGSPHLSRTTVSMSVLWMWLSFEQSQRGFTWKQNPNTDQTSTTPPPPLTLVCETRLARARQTSEMLKSNHETPASPAGKLIRKCVFRVHEVAKIHQPIPIRSANRVFPLPTRVAGDEKRAGGEKRKHKRQISGILQRIRS